MNQDSFFYIGKTHNICQDYAIHDKDYAIVSDGCSGSPHTDFGSRFLALGARHAVSLDLDAMQMAKLALVSAVEFGKAADLPSNHLDATLAVVRRRNNSINAFLAGDGIIAARDKSGAIIVKEITFVGGAPIYLNYLNHELRLETLHKTFDCTKMIKTTIIYKDGEEESEEKSLNMIESFDFDVAEYDYVAVMTDGVASFQRLVATPTSKTYEMIKTSEIVKQLMAIKGNVGSFVERRCKAFQRDCLRDGIIHADDFSVGMIHTG